MRKEVPVAEHIDRYFQRLSALKQMLVAQPESDLPLLESDTYWRHALNILENQARNAWNINLDNFGAVLADSMASYILWLAQTRFPNDKIIVWTHSNINALRNPQIPVLGTALAAVLGQDLFTV